MGIRVERGWGTVVGMKWYPGQEPQPAVMYDSDITRDIVVPHKAANITGDTRIVAAGARFVHGRRFIPNRMPKGVSMETTVPHDCENHLD
jgi:hypothetical protein